jgi:hypothetical protein
LCQAEDAQITELRERSKEPEEKKMKKAEVVDLMTVFGI